MWLYLDLMNRTSTLLEDLYISILDELHIKRSNQFTIFQSIHWQGYRNIILKDPTIKRVIDEL